MRHVRAILLLALAAACARSELPATDSGTGAGDAKVRAVETTGRTGLRVLGLTQGTVRACSGTYQPPTRADQVRTTELACTGGVTGSATVAPGQAGGRSVRWELETGESGRTPL